MKRQRRLSPDAGFAHFLTPPVVAVLVGLIILVGFAMRLHKLGWESLWYDELLQLDIASNSALSIFARLKRHSALPLDYLIAHFWMLGGRGEAWIRFPAVFFGVLALPMSYQFGRRLVDPAVGVVLAILLTLSPLHFYYSQEVRPYTLLVFGVTLAAYAYWQLRTTGRWRYYFLLQVGVLIFGLAHFFALTVFIPWGGVAVLDLIFSPRRVDAAKALAGLILSGLVVLLLILSMGYGNAVFNSSARFGEALVVEPEKFSAAPEEKPNKGTGPQVNVAFVEDRVLKPLGIRRSEIALWLFNALAVIGLFWLLLQRKFKLAFLLLTWTVLPIVLILAFLVFRGTFYAPRYIMQIMPAYLLLIAIGLLALPRWLSRIEARWLPVGSFVLIGGFIVWRLLIDIEQLDRWRDKEDWRLVTQFLHQNAAPEDMLIFPNADAINNWYWPDHQVAPDYFDRLEDVQQMVVSAKRSWVVLSVFSDSLPDSGRIKAWLSEEGAIRLALDPLITVYYLGYNASPDALLTEIQGFALPVDHALYASLARENRRHPDVARRYYQLAIDQAPDDKTKAAYQAAMEAIGD